MAVGQVRGARGPGSGSREPSGMVGRNRHRASAGREAPELGRYSLKPRETHTWPALRRRGGLRECEGAAFFLKQ